MTKTLSDRPEIGVEIVDPGVLLKISRPGMTSPASPSMVCGLVVLVVPQNLQAKDDVTCNTSLSCGDGGVVV